MIAPALETIAEALNYGELPETWRVPEEDRFSPAKTLYDYQTDALRKAARALYLYYGKDHDWVSSETEANNIERKKQFASIYGDAIPASLNRYETRTDRRDERQNPVFKILSEYIRPWGDEIPYQNLINRMCFWMATGSGKTLVMVKLIEYLHFLKKHGEIPPHNILILAPSEQLITQIRRTVEEFNESGLSINLVPLREMHKSRQGSFSDSVTVYYHRSDNISDEQKEARTDYRTYENGGKWYVFLDEAHKGGKENSKRQAYYAVMAREGFLFNFSATFTDEEDIVTTVKKYNLEEFINKGHGKSIYLNEQEYTAFRNRDREINPEERKRIVLKSLITLAYVCQRVDALRKETKIENLYHRPLMLTLVNSVNTEADKNDLWAFFETLREIAGGEIETSFFREAKKELADDWRDARLLFGEDGGAISWGDESSIQAMKIEDLREAVFLSRRKGALQVVRSKDNKELAFQMRNADKPFALIRIGDTSKWRNKLLAEYDKGTTVFDKDSFFSDLEQSRITIFMGSRSFFESWDSNRPNVINFINIGGADANKFVMQSVGRGVRIEPLPGKRGRHAFLPTEDGEIIKNCQYSPQPVETLFLFATNRKAVETVLGRMEAEKTEVFENLENIVPTEEITGKKMLLLVPEYREESQSPAAVPFSMSEKTLGRLKEYLNQTSDSVFSVRDGLAPSQVSALRGMAAKRGAVKIQPDKNYAIISFLQHRLLSHLESKVKVSDGVRKIDKDRDIVHFRQIRAHPRRIKGLREKVEIVKAGKPESITTLNADREKGLITDDEFIAKVQGRDEETYCGLTIKRLLNHYYIPVIAGTEKVDYIQHIIKVKSEVDFLNDLEGWLKDNNKPDWDDWMFSKIDESLDDIHIPYFDSASNEYRRFLPDFVFWMCKGNKYRIVFVDPKGDAHASSYHKIDGYKKLFLQNYKVRSFKHGKYQVSVNLFYYKPDANPLNEYKDFWIDDPAAIFANPPV